MEEIPTKNVSGNVTNDGDGTTLDGWVSPDVLAARNGETVEFGKDTNPDNEDPANA